MAALELKLLGGFELCDGAGEKVPIRSKKLRALLGYLGLQPDKTHEREVLATLLWGDRTEAKSRQSLRQGLLTLRKCLEAAGVDLLQIDGSTLSVDGALLQVDAIEFEHHARQGDVARACDLYAGDLLIGLNGISESFDEWLVPERSRLHSLACEVFERWGEACCRDDRVDTAIEVISRLVTLNPLHEGGHRLLMQALARAGRRADALQVYRTLTHTLRRELDVQPEQETTRLFDAIRLQGAAPTAGLSSKPQPTDAADPRAAADKPSIAVLPFLNLSGDRKQDILGDGLAEDLTTALSRFRWLFVISRNSAFRYKGELPDVRDVGRDLGARYVVEGSVLRGDDKVRVTAQLIETASGNHVWAQRYDRAAADLFELQDQLTDDIAGSIEPELADVERTRAHGQKPENLSAWENYQLGLWNLYQFTKSTTSEGRQLLERAIDCDPTFASAYAGLAYGHLMDVGLGFGNTPDLSVSSALIAARKAVELDDRDAFAHCVLGRVHTFLGDDSTALDELRTSLALTPSFAFAHYGLGHALIGANRPDEAIRAFDTANRLSPRDPFLWLFDTLRSFAHFMDDDFERSIELAERAIGRSGPPSYWPHVHLAAALSRLGRIDRARQAVENARDCAPNLSIEFLNKSLPYGPKPHFDGYLEALRAAGLSEFAGDENAEKTSETVDQMAARTPIGAAPRHDQAVLDVPKGPPLVPPDKPSIAVLPFDNLSGDPGQEYFADAITEDIITALSKIRWFFVIARHSSFAFKGRTSSVADIARELGVRYVLEGSVRKDDARVRVTAQLIDATTAGHVWAERYDHELADFFTLQDEMTQTIVAAIEPELTAAERERAMRKPPESLDAWDLFHRALWHLYQFTDDGNREADRLLHAALEADATFAQAHAALAYLRMTDVMHMRTESRDATLAEGLAAARKAIALDDREPLGHLACGRIQLMRCEYDDSIFELEKALALNPNFAQAYLGLGMTLHFVGRHEQAIECYEKATRLSPHDPYLWAFHMMRAYALVELHRHDEALIWARSATHQGNALFWAWAILAVTLGHLGRIEEAKPVVAELLRRNPKFSCAFARDGLYYSQWPEELEYYIEGLRKAGVPLEGG